MSHGLSATAGSPSSGGEVVWNRLIWLEVRRTVARRRYALLIAVNAAFALYAVLATRNSVYPGTIMTAPIAFAVSYVAVSLMPVVAPFALGDSLAADRVSGYLMLQLTRSVPRPLLASSRAVAAIISGVVAALVSAVPCLIAAYELYPPSGGDPTAAVAFLPGLLAQSPALYVLLMAALYGLAAGAVATCALAVGTFVRRPIAASMVAVFLLGTGLVIPVQWANPLERIMFASTWQATWTTPVSMTLYWGAIVALAIVVATARLTQMDDCS